MIRRGIGALLALPLLFGCAVGNRWGSPRAIPAGSLAHVITVDMGAANGDLLGDDSDFSALPIVWPTYTLRAGLGGPAELGVGLGYMLGIHGDVKVELLRSSWFDLAVVPGVGVQPWNTFHSEDAYTAWVAEVPLLLGINLGEGISILPSATPQLLRFNGDREKSSQLSWAANLAVQFRGSDWVAFQPAVSGFLAGDIAVIGVGMGWVLGAQPEY